MSLVYASVLLLVSFGRAQPVILGLAYDTAGQNTPPWVEVVWQDDGASTYTVERSGASGGPYAVLPANTGLAVCGPGCLLDEVPSWGSAYFYVLIAQAGQSPELAVTLPARFDLNGDGTVNILDVALAVQQTLGTAPCTNADLNGDAICNILDINLLVAAVLGP